MFELSDLTTMTTTEYENIFKTASKTILQMNEEVEQIGIKYGLSSRLYLSKIETIKSITQLYDTAAELYNNAPDPHLEKMRDITARFLELHFLRTTTGIEYKKIAMLYGLQSEQCQRADEALNNYMNVVCDILSTNEATK